MAMANLLSAIGKCKAKAIVTFPNANCSNGLSGAAIKKLAAMHFAVEEHEVESHFSTLGGTNRKSRTGNLRKPRLKIKELILTLHPKNNKNVSSPGARPEVSIAPLCHSNQEPRNRFDRFQAGAKARHSISVLFQLAVR
jgi:hypothetical protein